MFFLSVLLFFVLLISIFKNRNDEGFSKDATLPLRGVLALCIVLHHLSLRLMYMIPEASFFNLSEFIKWGEPIVSVFFFMSGYGLIKSFLKKGTNYLDGFLTGRLSKIMIPYIICCVLYIPFNNNNLSSILGNVEKRLPFFAFILVCYYHIYFVFVFLHISKIIFVS